MCRHIVVIAVDTIQIQNICNRIGGWTKIRQHSLSAAKQIWTSFIGCKWFASVPGIGGEEIDQLMIKETKFCCRSISLGRVYWNDI